MLMRRLELNKAERLQVYDEIDVKEETRALTPLEFQDLTLKIKKSKCYNEFMMNKSIASYRNTMGYIKQEGLLENLYIAIVDSGWSGSMQRSLRQLMEREGYCGDIVGFYFGLFNAPKEKKDGEYESFYFNVFNNMKNKLYFDNTLFECMLSAPHGMTVGFSFKDGKYEPIFKENMNEDRLDFICEQITGVMKYAEQKVKTLKQGYVWTKSVDKVYKILKRAMIFPTKDETEAYCKFEFCDDVSEAIPRTLIQKNMLLMLKNYMLIPKVIAKLLHKDDLPIDDVFWPYGTISYFKYPMRLWCRWNIVALQFLRYMRTAIKEKRRISK